MFIASVLLFILGYLFVNGARNLDLAFFTELPKPVGESGGGMGSNAVLGSAKILAMATIIGVPIRISRRRVSSPSTSNKSFAFVVRYQ